MQGIKKHIDTLKNQELQSNKQILTSKSQTEHPKPLRSSKSNSQLLLFTPSDKINIKRDQSANTTTFKKSKKADFNFVNAYKQLVKKEEKTPTNLHSNQLLARTLKDQLLTHSESNQQKKKETVSQNQQKASQNLRDKSPLQIAIKIREEICFEGLNEEIQNTSLIIPNEKGLKIKKQVRAQNQQALRKSINICSQKQNCNLLNQSLTKDQVLNQIQKNQTSPSVQNKSQPVQKNISSLKKENLNRSKDQIFRKTVSSSIKRNTQLSSSFCFSKNPKDKTQNILNSVCHKNQNQSTFLKTYANGQLKSTPIKIQQRNAQIISSIQINKKKPLKEQKDQRQQKLLKEFKKFQPIRLQMSKIETPKQKQFINNQKLQYFKQDKIQTLKQNQISRQDSLSEFLQLEEQLQAFYPSMQEIQSKTYNQLNKYSLIENFESRPIQLLGDSQSIPSIKIEN